MLLRAMQIMMALLPNSHLKPLPKAFQLHSQLVPTVAPLLGTNCWMTFFFIVVLNTQPKLVKESKVSFWFLVGGIVHQNVKNFVVKQF